MVDEDLIFPYNKLKYLAESHEEEGITEVLSIQTRFLKMQGINYKDSGKNLKKILTNFIQQSMNIYIWK